MNIQQIEEMWAQFPFETKFKTCWFNLSGQIVPVFDPVGVKRTLVFRAMDLGHVKIIVTTEPCIVVVPYFLSAKKSILMQAMFWSVVFKVSDSYKILRYIA